MITAESGIGSTRELGKYLGMPILQKRMNKETFGEILERVSARLAGWKSKLGGSDHSYKVCARFYPGSLYECHSVACGHMGELG